MNFGRREKIIRDTFVMKKILYISHVFCFFLITTDLHTMDIGVPCENEIKESFLYKEGIFKKWFTKTSERGEMIGIDKLKKIHK